MLIHLHSVATRVDYSTRVALLGLGQAQPIWAELGPAQKSKIK